MTDTTKYHGIAIGMLDQSQDCRVVGPADFYLKSAQRVLEGRAAGTLTPEQDDGAVPLRPRATGRASGAG
jgi:hypothetical protein